MTFVVIMSVLSWYVHHNWYQRQNVCSWLIYSVPQIHIHDDKTACTYKIQWHWITYSNLIKQECIVLIVLRFLWWQADEMTVAMIFLLVFGLLKYCDMILCNGNIMVVFQVKCCIVNPSAMVVRHDGQCHGYWYPGNESGQDIVLI